VIEALLSFPKPFMHRPGHDLESILYVIFYFCTYFKGPGLHRDSDDLPEMVSIPMERWFRQETFTQIARDKCGVIITAHASLFPTFTPYWADFVPFVHRLISACFPQLPDFTNMLTHDIFLEILREAYNTVEEHQYISEQSVQDNRSAKRRKLTV
jgi:hypothetical protein